MSEVILIKSALYMSLIIVLLLRAHCCYTQLMPLCRPFAHLTVVPPSGDEKKMVWQAPPGDKDERAESKADCLSFHQNVMLLCAKLDL